MNALQRVRAWHIATVCALFFGALTYFLHVRADSFRDSFFSFIPLIESKILDTKFKVRGRVDTEPRVVIAAGDEKTIADPAFGLWGAWDRSVYADIVENLLAAGADVVGFDMTFADQVGIAPVKAEEIMGLLDEASLEERAEAAKHGEGVAELADVALGLEQTIRAARAGTERFGEVLDEHSSRVTQGIILNPQSDPGAVAVAGGQAAFRALQDERFEAIADFGIEHYSFSLVQETFANAAEGMDQKVVRLAEPRPVSELTHVESIDGEMVIPLEAYLESAEYIGFFNATPDDDGVMRALPVVFRYKDRLFPSLSLSVATQAVGASPLLVGNSFSQQGLLQVAIPTEDGGLLEIPVDDRGKLLINYLGPSKPFDLNDPADQRGVFPRISLSDIRRNEFDKELVKGRVVLVAVTAIGTFDQRVTPFTSLAPGVETHAAAVQSMLTGNALRRLVGYVQIEMLLALLVALGGIFVLPRVGVVPGVLLTFGLSVGWVLIDFYGLFRESMWFHQLPLQMQIWASWAGIFTLGYLTEGREKAQLKKEFSTVLAPTVVDQLLKNPELAGLGGDEREMTVMFSDIRGFTTMSEKMSPEGLTQFLNEYLTPMTDILMQHQGTLDKYMGDAIMAFWGAPMRQPDHAAKACVAALDMLDRLAELRERWRAEGKPAIDIGIGLNTGLMRVGFMGSERMRNYTLLGDNVNLGSRLEGINKQYATNIIVSEYTFNAAKAEVHGRVVDLVRVKGKHEPVTIYELVGRGANPAGRLLEKLELFNEGLRLYRNREFEKARDLFTRGVTEFADGTAGVYVDRCSYFMADPPGENWDGVYVMKTK